MANPGLPGLPGFNFPGAGPSNPKLQVGQGTPGGRAGQGVNTRNTPRGLPAAPPNTRVRPQPPVPAARPGAVIPGSAGAGLHGVQRFPQPPTKPVAMSGPKLMFGPTGPYVGHSIDMPTAKPVGESGKQAAVLRRGPGLMFTNGLDPVHQKLQPVESKALKAIQDPVKNYNPKDEVSKGLISDPTPRLQWAIQSDPQLQQNHARLLEQMDQRPGLKMPPFSTQPAPKNAGRVTPAAPTVDPKSVLMQAYHMLGKTNVNDPSYAASQGNVEQFLAENAHVLQSVPPAERPQYAKIEQLLIAADQADNQQTREGILKQTLSSMGPLAWPTSTVLNAAQEAGAMMTGFGPGMYALGSGVAKDVYNGRYSMPTLRHTGYAVLHSYGQTIHHPLRQMHDQPITFASNVLTPFFVGAGAYARGLELAGLIGELGAEGSTMTGAQFARAAGRTMLRPQPVERTIRGPGGTIHPPAVQSALGGLLQKHVFDPLVERHINASELADKSSLLKPVRFDKGGPFSFEGYYGREARRQGVREQQILSGRAVGRGAEEKDAIALAAMAHHANSWHSIYDNSMPAVESYFENPDKYYAVKKPPEINQKNFKATKYANPTLVGKQWDSMIVRNPAKIAANPDDYRYIPKQVFDSMRETAPAQGTAANVLNVINSGSQMIRSGRLMHPGYLAWAVQNGLIHLSQAGPWAFRNAWQLRNQFSRLSPEVQAAMRSAAGVGLSKTLGGEAVRLPEKLPVVGGRAIIPSTKKLSGWWAKVNDEPLRLMSLIHDLNHAGYHNAEDWTNLVLNRPREFQKFSGRSGRSAIEYLNEMTPAERDTLGKLFTAYGWTRGSAMYTLRFPWQHPVQARGAEQIGTQGEQQVNSFYEGHNGMVPDWLAGYLPLSDHNSPWLLSGGILNPAETLGSLLHGIPGLGATEALSGELAPVPSAGLEAITGMTPYGQNIRGATERLTTPIADALKRFQPYSAYKTLRGGRTSGTFVGGAGAFFAGEFGTGAKHLADINKTASLGLKDYEQSLDKPDEIRFRTEWSLQQLPRQIYEYEKRNGEPPDPSIVGKLKGDLEMVQQRDLYQYHYAIQHGAKSWKSLPAANKLAGTAEFLIAHHYATQQEVAGMVHDAQGLPGDKALESYIRSAMWTGVTHIGIISNVWNNIKDIGTPPKVTPPNK